jgi:hypothetical protein
MLQVNEKTEVHLLPEAPAYHPFLQGFSITLIY